MNQAHRELAQQAQRDGTGPRPAFGLATELGAKPENTRGEDAVTDAALKAWAWGQTNSEVAAAVLDLLARVDGAKAKLAEAEWQWNGWMSTALAIGAEAKAMREGTETVAADCELKGNHPPLNPDDEVEVDQRYIYRNIGGRLRAVLARRDSP